MGNINQCTQCKLEKTRCKICNSAYCIIHDDRHNKGVAHFGEDTHLAFYRSRFNTIDGSNQGQHYFPRSPRHRPNSPRQYHPNSPRGESKTTEVNKSSGHKKVCPAPGCESTPLYECISKACCGLFCSQHANHNHFKCQYDKCQQFATQSMLIYKEKSYCEKHYNFEWAMINSGSREVATSCRDLSGYTTMSSFT